MPGVRIYNDAFKVERLAAHADRHHDRHSRIKGRSRRHIQPADADVACVRDSGPVTILKPDVNDQLLTVNDTPLRWQNSLAQFISHTPAPLLLIKTIPNQIV